MNTKKLKLLVMLALASIASIIMGCTNLKPSPITLTAIRVAANSGASIAILDRPDWRPQFTKARDELGTYLKVGTLTGEQLAGILSELPVKELKSNEARIIISNVTILFDDYIRQATDVERLGAVRDVAQAIYDGLDVALKSTPEQLKAVKTLQRR